MGTSLGRAVNAAEWVFPTIASTYDASHKQLIYVKCEEAGSDVPVMLVAPAYGGRLGDLRRLVYTCVIYFHPNAVDIGDCVEDMEAICDGAYGGDAMVLAPEYPGYGMLGDFEPSVAGIDLVAMATWKFCVDELGFRADRVMLWGRSIGCGPAAGLAHALALAQRLKSTASASSKAAGGHDDNVPLDCPWQAALAPVPVGALVLMAPYVSISAVVEHHTASPFLASLVGPMWKVLDYVKDPVMQEVALCILHPKEDDIIPSDHGLSIYQNSVCRRKYGIWLSNATHNFQPEEDHFTLVRSFLNSVISAHQLIRQRTQMSKGNGEAEGGGGGAAIGDELWYQTSADAEAMPLDPETEHCEDLAVRMLHWGGIETSDALMKAGRIGPSAPTSPRVPTPRAASHPPPQDDCAPGAAPAAGKAAVDDAGDIALRQLRVDSRRTLRAPSRSPAPGEEAAASGGLGASYRGRRKAGEGGEASSASGGALGCSSSTTTFHI